MARLLAVFISAVLALTPVLSAFAREPGRRAASQQVRATASAAEATDMFAAETQGLVAVRYIPNDSRSAQVIVTNRTNRPVTLRLPLAFAGVPVLAQMGGGMGGMGGGGGGAGFGAGGIGGGPQTTGGGMGGQGMNGMGGGGMGGGGGAFSIPPQKTRVLRIATVCLEHGKPEPSSRYPYKLAAIDSFSSDPKLTLVLESLGRGELPQKVAQAAAWHLSNGMSWERLAAEKIDHAGGVPDESYFAPAELMAAQQVVALATQKAAALQPAKASASSSISNQ
jgi:hypothetical protein